MCFGTPFVYPGPGPGPVHNLGEDSQTYIFISIDVLYHQKVVRSSLGHDGEKQLFCSNLKRQLKINYLR